VIGGRPFRTTEDGSDDGDDDESKSATEYGFLFKPSAKASK
jgi:hypothetical protein